MNLFEIPSEYFGQGIFITTKGGVQHLAIRQGVFAVRSSTLVGQTIRMVIGNFGGFKTIHF